MSTAVAILFVLVGLFFFLHYHLKVVRPGNLRRRRERQVAELAKLEAEYRELVEKGNKETELNGARILSREDIANMSARGNEARRDASRLLWVKNRIRILERKIGKDEE